MEGGADGRSARFEFSAFANMQSAVTEPRAFHHSNSKVYVGNLAWAVSWQDLKDHMRGTGEALNVAHVEVLTDSSGRSKGCAIVEYSTPEVRNVSNE